MRIARSLGVLAVVAVALGYGAWAWRVHDETMVRLRRAQALEERDGALRASVADSERQASDLRRALQESSNRVVEVETLLDEEKSTHDPLRRQIETMVAEQIALRETLKQKEALIKKHEGALADARQVGQDMQTGRASLEQRVARDEADLKAAGEREEALRSQLTEARHQVAAAQAELDQLRRRLEAGERALEATPRLPVSNAVTVPAP